MRSILDHRERKKIQEALSYAEKHLSSLHRHKEQSYARHGNHVSQILEESVTSPTLLRVAVLHDILRHPNGETLLLHAPLSRTEKSLIRAWHHSTVLEQYGTFSDWPVFRHAPIDPRLHILLATHHRSDLSLFPHLSMGERKWMCRKILRDSVPALRILRFHEWATTMEDVCFLELCPQIARRLKFQWEATGEREMRCLERTVECIRDLLKKEGITPNIEYRRKSLYSIHKKMCLTGQSFRDIHDRLGVRIIAPSVQSCYQILRCLHRHFTFVLEQCSDFIRTPKPSGYRSLHSLLLSAPEDGGSPIEVQVRTEDMHWQNEYGFARHVLYKLRSYSSIMNVRQMFGW